MLETMDIIIEYGDIITVKFVTHFISINKLGAAEMFEVVGMREEDGGALRSESATTAHHAGLINEVARRPPATVGAR